MKEELNIAAILRDKPKGTKLWSPMFGECELCHINDDIDNSVSVVSTYGLQSYEFVKDGRFSEKGEVCIFPSKEMRDWSKFAWKKGDVLVYKEGEEPYYAIFDEFQDDEYTAFKSRYNYGGGNHWLQFNSQSSTNHFVKASDDEAKEFIKKVEEHYGGKLNLSTLEIEKQPEFKDGDIVVFCNGRGCYDTIAIIKEKGLAIFKVYAFLEIPIMKLYLNKDIFHIYTRVPRPASDEEKQQLFDSLAKEGKRWNSETLQIEDLPKKCEFKEFGKVLVRMRQNNIWKMAFFIEMCKDKSDMRYPYRVFNIEDIINDLYAQCIPYNDQTAHLLGTTDEWKGGEG